MRKILIKALRRIGLLDRLTLYPWTTIQGTKVCIPLINDLGTNNYLYPSEPWMLSVLKKILTPENQFVDIGVNLGQTLIKVKSIDKAISYVGFEPNPLCVFYVGRMIKVNAFPNTEIYPVGVSEKSEVLKLNLYSDADHDSSASIISEFRASSYIKKSINVPVFNIEELDLGKMDVVKIDVEGAELEVLNGLKNQLSNDKPNILIEILPVYSNSNKERLDRQNSIEALMSKYGYSMFRIKKNKEDQYAGIEKIQSLGIHSDLQQCDYIFSPNEKENEVIKSLKV